MTAYARWLQRSMVALSMMGLACTPVLDPPRVRPAQAVPKNSQRIVIIKSGDNPIFTEAMEGFLTRFSGEVRIYNLPTMVDAPNRALLQALDGLKPDLVYCLGNAAGAFAHDYLQDVPVLYALVPDAVDLRLNEMPNFFGIAIEPPPVMEFSHFLLVLPKLKRVLTFYNAAGGEQVVHSATLALHSLGIELTAVAVTDQQALEKAFAQNVEACDAVWMPGDKVVMNSHAFDFLKEQTLNHRKALLTSISHKFTQAGAFMSASLSLRSIGSQSALLAHRVLDEGVATKVLGMQAPIGVQLAVNLEVASRLGLEIAPAIFPYIDRIFLHVQP